MKLANFGTGRTSLAISNISHQNPILLVPNTGLFLRMLIFIWYVSLDFKINGEKVIALIRTVIFGSPSCIVGFPFSDYVDYYTEYVYFQNFTRLLEMIACKLQYICFIQYVD